MTISVLERMMEMESHPQSPFVQYAVLVAVTTHRNATWTPGRVWAFLARLFKRGEEGGLRKTLLTFEPARLQPLQGLVSRYECDMLSMLCNMQHVTPQTLLPADALTF